MNASVDYRTDFFSLGVILYQLIAGTLPFRGSDDAETMYMILASEPRDLRSYRAETPAVLSKIVGKLLKKNPADRYESAEGIVHDLSQCLLSWRESGRIEDFEPGRKDISKRFSIRDRLYGRETEVSALIAAFESAAAGQAHLIEISGPSGIGKTALVDQLRQPLVSRQGIFLQGKFDQFKRNIPYHALASALNDFVASMLRDDEERSAAFVRRLKQALSGSERILFDLVPLLPKLLGSTMEALPGESDKADYKIRRALLAFINAIATQESPLAVFLDDIQWADTGSLDMIEALVKPGACTNMLLLVAYRDNEVSPSHPALLCLNAVRQMQVPVSKLDVGPLSEPAIEELLGEALQSDRSKVFGLAKIVLAKTAGNAFFVKTFLNHLAEQKLIVFDDEELSWKWDEKAISGLAVTENVTEILISKMQHLTPESRMAISVAACVGRRFDLFTMSILTGRDLITTARQLSSAEKLSFIESMSLNLDLLIQSAGQSQSYNGKEIFFRFVHDRVQQAAYELLNEEERRQVRARIGKMLLASLSRDEVQERLHEIADHLNHSDTSGGDPETKRLLLELNIKAGKMAQSSGAFDVALKYFLIAAKHQPGDPWSENYAAACDIMFGLARSYLSLNKYEEGTRVLRQGIGNLRSPLETASAWEILGAFYETNSEYNKCIKACLSGLRALRISMKEKNNDLRLVLEVGRFKAFWSKKAIRMPDSGWPRPDARWQMIQKLVTRMATSSFHVNQNLFVLQYIRLFVAAIKEKVYIDNPACSGVLGMVMVIIRDTRSALTFQAIARRQLEERRYEESSPIFYCADCHWMAPIDETYRQCLEIGKQGYAKAIEFGDLPFAGVTAFLAALTAIGGGFRLPEIEKLNEVFRHFFTKVNPDNYMAAGFLAIAQTARAFAGQTSSPESMSADDIDEKSIEEKCRRSPGDTSMYRVMKSWILFHNGNYAGVVRLGLFNLIQRTLPGCFTAAINATIVSISILRLLRTGKMRMPRFFALGTVRILATELLWWSGKGKVSSGLRNLVLGEYFWTRGRYSRAVAEFERATAFFVSSDQYYWAATAQESLARLYQSLGANLPTTAHLDQARQQFLRYGATPKAQALAAELEAAGSIPTAQAVSNRSSASSHTSTATGVINSGIIDLESLAKVAQAISGEMNQDKLVTEILRLAMENAGATHGCILIAEGERLVLRVRGSMEQAGFSGELQAVTVGSVHKDQLPLKVIRYSLKTSEEVVLGGKDPAYQDDDYLRSSGTQSVMCIPISSEKAVSGILVLENRLNANAFTSERLRSLRVISAQAAVSLKNAGFVHDIGILKSHLEKILEGTRDMAASQSLDTAIKIAIKTIGQEVPRFSGSEARVISRSGNGPYTYTERSLKVDQTIGAISQSESTAFEWAEYYEVSSVTPVNDHAIVVPIRWQDQTVSLLAFDKLADVNLSKEDIRFVETLCQSLALSLRNIEHQVRLEQLVEERTNELHEALRAVTAKQKKIQIIMDNIDQGILTVVSSLRIEDEFSAKLPAILQVGQESVPGADLSALVFSDSNLSAEEVNRIAETLKIVVGDDEFSWDLNCGHLPSEVTIKRPTGERILAMDWKPLFDHSNTIEKVMLVIRDLTDQRMLEETTRVARAEHERKLAAVGRMLQMDRARLRSFLADVLDRVIRVRTASVTQGDYSEVFREVHTIKGLSSSMGFRDVAELAHHAEDCLPLTSRGSDEFRPREFYELIGKIEELIGWYSALHREVFTDNENSDLSLQNMTVSLRSRVVKIVQNSSLEFRCFDVSDQIAVWQEPVAKTLSAILPHCVNNAIDHGYLIPSIRGQMVGPIDIKVSAAMTQDRRIEVIVSDRGVGLNHEKLKQLAGEAGLQDSDYLEVLFLDGKSTAGTVSETSGRGVGLGAARKMARDQGGDVVLTDRPDGGTECRITLAVADDIPRGLKDVA